MVGTIGIIKAVTRALTDRPRVLGDQQIRPSIEYVHNASAVIKHLVQPGRPLYLIDLPMLRQRFARFSKAFRGPLPTAEIYFAVKCNNHPAIAEEIVKLGGGLDVSSGEELSLALQTDADRIIFTGPGKTDAELRLAIRHHKRIIVLVDSSTELQRLNYLAADQGRVIRIGVRMNVRQHGLWRKFGVAAHDVTGLLETIPSLKNISFRGLHIHTSWNMTPSAQVSAIAQLGSIIQSLPAAMRSEIRFIDIGGGYWPECGEWLQADATPRGRLISVLTGKSTNRAGGRFYIPSAPITEFADRISRAIAQYISPFISPKIFLEPGRWLAHDAMMLAMTVCDKKDDDLVITDAGTNMVGWERFESDYFPVVNISRPDCEERPCMVMGALCTPHDIWGYGYWGSSIQTGDILVIPAQGAYTYSLRQRFIKAVPDAVLLADNRATTEHAKSVQPVSSIVTPIEAENRTGLRSGIWRWQRH